MAEASAIYLGEAAQKARELGFLVVETHEGWTGVHPHVDDWRFDWMPDFRIGPDRYFGACMSLTVSLVADAADPSKHHIRLDGYDPSDNGLSTARDHGWTFDILDTAAGPAVQYRYIGGNPAIDAEINALYARWRASVARLGATDWSALTAPRTARQIACDAADNKINEALRRACDLNPLYKPAATMTDVALWRAAISDFEDVIARTDAAIASVPA